MSIGWGGEIENPVFHWPASLVKMANFRFSERACLKATELKGHLTPLLASKSMRTSTHTLKRIPHDIEN